MSKKLIFTVLVVITITLLLLVGCSQEKMKFTPQQTSGQPSAETEGANETQYLLFQLFTFSPTPEGKTQPFDKKPIEKTIDEILAAVGNNRGDGKTRQLGFSIGPLTLDHTDEELKTTIRESFQIAEEKNIAVAFHIDDSMFWISRKTLWKDKNNVEWTDWGGTVYPHRYIGWAPTVLAPQMCYNSPTLRKEVGRVIKDVIGAEIKKGIDNLKVKNKEYLFAGVIAGWETHLADYRYVSKDDEGAKKLGIKRERIGYCALSNYGYSINNPPKDFDSELEKMVGDWIGFWAKELNQAGISKERIYTHTVFLPAEEYLPSDEINQLAQRFKNEGVPTFSFLALNSHVLPKTGFNQYSRAGFSIYPSGVKTRDGTEALFATIYGELKRQGQPNWALSEGTNTAVGGSIKPSLSWEEYLGGMFNHGAMLVNIFAWQEPPESGSPYGKATKSNEAIAAYKKFLNGEKLSETQNKEETSPASTMDLPSKIQKIQKEAPQWMQQNPSRKSEAEQLLQKLDKYVKESNILEAEKTADEILGLIGK